MKSIVGVIGLISLLSGAESKHEFSGPVSLSAEEGKGVYVPIRERIDLEEEKRIQQKNATPGGRNEPMHNYPSFFDGKAHDKSMGH